LGSRPVVTVVADQGSDCPGVTRETPPPELPVQIFEPSYARDEGNLPRRIATVVTAPAGWLGSIL
jgi:hypothetical protein